MNKSTDTNDTPVLDPLQVKIALLLAGMSLCEWCRRNGFKQPTAWRAMYNIHAGPKNFAARRALAAFVDQINNPNGKVHS